MKPFNLERALAGDPVITRDGKKVVEVHRWKTLEDNGFALIALFEGDRFPTRYYLSGKNYRDINSNMDLFMAPRRTTKYILITDGTYVHDRLFQNRIEALRASVAFDNSQIIEIEIEE